MAAIGTVSKPSRPVSALLLVALLAGMLPLTSCEKDKDTGEIGYSSGGGALVAVLTAFAITAALLAAHKTEPAGVGTGETGRLVAPARATGVASNPRRFLWRYPHKPAAAPLMATSAILSAMFDELRSSEGGSGLGIRSVFDAFAGSFLDQAIDEVVAQHPQFLARIPDGVRFDYGRRYVDPSGNVISGRADVTCADIDATLSSVTATCDVVYDGYTVNGSTTQVDWLHWNVDLDMGPGDRVAGDVTVTGGTFAETSKPEPATVSGSAHFDTAVCAEYPIGGSILVTIGGETTTVTFTNACDGTYVLDLPGAAYWAFGFQLHGCSSSYSMEISLVEENGVLTVDRGISPWNQETFGAARWSAGGWITDTDVHIEFSAPANPDASNPNATPGVSGTFDGKRLSVIGNYAGEVTYTITEVPPTVLETCTATHTKVRDGHNTVYSCRGRHCR